MWLTNFLWVHVNAFLHQEIKIYSTILQQWLDTYVNASSTEAGKFIILIYSSNNLLKTQQNLDVYIRRS